MFPHSILSSGFAHINKSVARVAVIPATGFVRIKSGNGELVMSATDTHVISTATYQGDFPVLDVCLPADRMKTALGLLSGDISIKLDKTANLKGSRGSAKMHFLDGGMMPSYVSSNNIVASIPAKPLVSAMRKVSFAALEGGSRPFLKTIQFDCDGKELNVFATDGRFLAVETIPVDCDPFCCMLHTGSLPKIGDFSEEDATATFSAGFIKFSSRTLTTIVKLEDGKPIDWRKVVPDTKFSITLNREQLTRAARGTSNLYETSLAKWAQIKNDGQILVGADNGAEGGFFEVDGSGDHVDFCVNSTLLVSAIQGITSESVVIRWGDNFPAFKSPALLDDGNYRVVMGCVVL